MVGGLGLESARPALIQVLKNADDIRIEELACLALGEIGGDDAVKELIRRTSSTSVHVAAAAVRGLGGCLAETAFPYLMAALWGDQQLMITAAEWGIAAAVSPAFSKYLADNMEAGYDIRSRRIVLGSRGRLDRVLGGFNLARSGSESLVAPFADLIRKRSINEDDFSTPWLVDNVRIIATGEADPELHVPEKIEEKLLSADDVVSALEKYDTVRHSE